MTGSGSAAAGRSTGNFRPTPASMKRRWKRSIVAAILARQRHAHPADRLVDAFAQRVDRRGRRAAAPSIWATMRSMRRGPPVLDVGTGTGRPTSTARYSTRVPDRREQRLEEQVEQQVVAPDVDDEGDVGPDRGDVGEVLVRARRRYRRRRARRASSAPARRRDTSARSRSGCRYRSTRRLRQRLDLRRRTSCRCGLARCARRDCVRAPAVSAAGERALRRRRRGRIGRDFFTELSLA